MAKEEGQGTIEAPKRFTKN